MRHGTRSTYVHHKCRCEECRAAQAKYQREMYSAGKINANYKNKMNKLSRKRQQAATRWVKENHPDVWNDIVAGVR